MPKARELPADLIKEWAQKQTAASAKLAGLELPDGFIASTQAQQFLAMRHPDSSLGLRPIRNAYGQIVTWTDD